MPATRRYTLGMTGNPPGQGRKPGLPAGRQVHRSYGPGGCKARGGVREDKDFFVNCVGRQKKFEVRSSKFEAEEKATARRNGLNLPAGRQDTKDTKIT
jgi:hypothetical protein